MLCAQTHRQNKQKKTKSTQTHIIQSQIEEKINIIEIELDTGKMILNMEVEDRMKRGKQQTRFMDVVKENTKSWRDRGGC